MQDVVTPDVLNHVTYEAHENANLKAKEWGRFIGPVFCGILNTWMQEYNFSVLGKIGEHSCKDTFLLRPP